MPGYKQWADGDVLLPSELDEYIVGQTLMRFANAAARTAAIASPVAGMRSYLVDTGLEYIYANSAWAPMSTFIKKAATENVTSSTTLQDDDHLQLTLVPGTYRVELFCHVAGVVAGDFACAWQFSGTLSTSARSCIGPAIASTDVEAGTIRSSGHAIGTTVTYGAATTANAVVNEDLYLVVTAGGLLKFQWAQGTSSATATSLSSATRLYMNRLA